MTAPIANNLIWLETALAGAQRERPRACCLGSQTRGFPQWVQPHRGYTTSNRHAQG